LNPNAIPTGIVKHLHWQDISFLLEQARSTPCQMIFIFKGYTVGKGVITLLRSSLEYPFYGIILFSFFQFCIKKDDLKQSERIGTLEIIR